MHKHRGGLAKNAKALSHHEAAYYRRAQGKKPRLVVQTIAANNMQTPAADVQTRLDGDDALPADPAGANSEDWI